MRSPTLPRFRSTTALFRKVLIKSARADLRIQSTPAITTYCGAAAGRAVECFARRPYRQRGRVHATDPALRHSPLGAGLAKLLEERCGYLAPGHARDPTRDADDEEVGAAGLPTTGARGQDNDQFGNKVHDPSPA